MSKDSAKGAAGQQAAGRIVIGRRERMLLYIGATAVLAVLAFAFALLYSPNTGCGNIVIAGQRDSCLSSEALAAGNASYCSAIAQYGQRANCVDAVAQKLSYVGDCRILNGSYYSGCVSSVAVQSANATDCGLVNGSSRDLCYYGVAKAQNYTSESTCSGIRNATIGNECTYAYLYQSAIHTGNGSYCGMEPQAQNTTYLSDLIALAGNSSIADSSIFYYYNMTPRDFCYYGLAKSTLNESTCGLMPENQANLCYANFYKPSNTTNVTAENLTQICDSYPSDIKALCLSSSQIGEAVTNAIANKNATYCDQISQPGYRYSCFTDVAEQLGQSSICSDIANLTIRSYCYASVTNYST